MSSTQSCEIQIRVRYAECDPMGYLHHAKYFEYFEMGRTELLRQNGHAYRDMEATGTLFVVARAECKYHKPIRYDDVITLVTEQVRVTRARIDHHYEILRNGIRLCQAATTLACVDRNGSLQPIPDSLFTSHPGSNYRS